MKQPESGREWAQQLTGVVATALRHARETRLSAQQLSDRCAELGYPIPRSTIANIESGRKETLSVQELIVLARALDVPPLLLLFPLGRVDELELLPGSSAPTWHAAQWFTGENGFPTPGPEGGWDVVGSDQFSWKTAATRDFRDQDDAIDRWARARHRDDDEKAQSEERTLRLIRDRIRGKGLDPGSLPDELAHVDEGH